MNTTEPLTRDPDYDYFCTDQEKAACIVNGREELYTGTVWVTRNEDFEGRPLGLGATDFYRRRRTASWIPLSERRPTIDDVNGWGCVLILDASGTVLMSGLNDIHKEATHWTPIPKGPIKTQEHKDHALWLECKNALYVTYHDVSDGEFFFKAGLKAGLKAGRESLK